jgi:hypothetical protein
LAVALIGGVVGWFVALGVLAVFVQMLDRMETGRAGHVHPEIEGDLVLGSLVCGVPSGAVLGLIIWLVWFLVSRRNRAAHSESSPDPPA